VKGVKNSYRFIENNNMSFSLSPVDLSKFRNYIYNYFDRYGRHLLPWRTSYDPYQVMVSEIMLQQTQVDRVIPKFEAFLDQFPTVEVLAAASAADVIKAWQGLGYNRRGLRLQQAAQYLVQHYQGHLPQETDSLLSIPGIGPYTAAAIQAFAFNLPSVVVETNIRTIFIFHFFHEDYNVSDDQIAEAVKVTLDYDQPRLWYSALMDYGSFLKTVVPNPSRKSRHYSKQSRFAGSNRQARGSILKALTQQAPLSLSELQTNTALPVDRLQPALQQLIKEGFIKDNGDNYRLP
jgi:A/G-specific adenine glycosylase